MNVALLGGPAYVACDIARRCRFLQFSFGPPGGTGLVVTYSAAATPGRYVAELARRSLQAGPRGPVAVINPSLALTRVELGFLLESLATQRAAGTVIVRDTAGKPLAYRFEEALVSHHARELALLSTIDAGADEGLLRALSPAVSVLALPYPFEFSDTPVSFRGAEPQRSAYVWAAARAAKELAGAKGPVPMATVLPFHGGDILFLVLALQRTGMPARAVVVERRYADIVKAVAPDIDCIEIELDATPERSLDTTLTEYLVRDMLPTGYLYAYGRPSRLYNAWPIHLMDQYAFAFATVPPAASVRDVPPPGRERPAGARRVLVHFDAGWSLKVFPAARQHELAQQLADSGFSVTLATPGEAREVAGFPNIRIRNLAHLDELLRQHDLFIGMDSFPAHYAAHIVGVPALCLFGSTTPANSDAAPSPRYRALEEGLTCSPCEGLTECPRFGGEECRNLPISARVVAAATELLSGHALAEQPGRGATPGVAARRPSRSLILLGIPRFNALLLLVERGRRSLRGRGFQATMDIVTGFLRRKLTRGR